MRRGSGLTRVWIAQVKYTHMIDVHFKPNPPSNAAEAAHMDTAEIYKQKTEHFVCRIRPWPMRAP